MKKYKWIIIAIIVIVVIIGIILLSKKKVINKFTFPTELIIKNNTKNKGVDTIAMVILNKIMKIDTINLNIFDIKEGTFNNETIDIMAYIEKYTFGRHQYVLFLSKDFKGTNIINIISHEMIHVQQMENGELIQVTGEKYAIYKNDTIFYLKTPYELRPFEIAAINKQFIISNELYKLLYK